MQNNKNPRPTAASKNQKRKKPNKPKRLRNKPLVQKFPHSSERGHEAGVPKMHLRHAEQFVDPDKYPYAVLQPDNNSKNRCVRKFTKSFTVDSSMAGCTNGFRLAVLPSFDSPIVFSGPDTNVPALPGIYRVSGQGWVEGGVIVHSTLRVDSGSSTAVVQFAPITDSAGTTKMGIYASNAVGVGTQDMKPVVEIKDSKHSNPVAVSAYQMRAGVWTLIARKTVSRLAPSSFETGGYAGTAIAFEFEDPVSGSGTGIHSVNFEIANYGTAVGTVGGKALHDMTQGVLMNDLRGVAQYARLTGLSLLITNTSSALARHGNIFTARVPRTNSPFNSPAHLQKDVIDFYRGQAAEGSYVWWLPGEQSTRTMTDLHEASEQLDSDSFLWAAVEGWGGTEVSSVLVTVTACVEFYALSQLYEKISPPIVDPSWERTMGVLARMPSATCNPAHVELFRNLLKQGKQAYDKVSGHYTANRALYDSLARLLMTSL